MMNNESKLTDPMPLLYYPEGERVFYLAPGPAVLLFTIELKEILRLHPISKMPVMGPTKHPFGEVTAVCSLAVDVVRRAFAQTRVIADDDPNTDTLTLWCDFCDALAERINEGEQLEFVLETTWRLSSSTSPAPCTTVEDAGDVELDDDDDADQAADMVA